MPAKRRDQDAAADRDSCGRCGRGYRSWCPRRSRCRRTRRGRSHELAPMVTRSWITTRPRCGHVDWPGRIASDAEALLADHARRRGSSRRRRSSAKAIEAQAPMRVRRPMATPGPITAFGPISAPAPICASAPMTAPGADARRPPPACALGSIAGPPAANERGRASDGTRRANVERGRSARMSAPAFGARCASAGGMMQAAGAVCSAAPPLALVIAEVVRRRRDRQALRPNGPVGVAADLRRRRKRPDRHRSERFVETGVDHAPTMLAPPTPDVTPGLEPGYCCCCLLRGGLARHVAIVRTTLVQAAGQRRR